MKKFLTFWFFTALTCSAFAGENPSNRLKKAYVSFGIHKYIEPEAENNNENNVGLILNSNEIYGTLHIERQDSMEYRIPVKIVFEGIGATAFVRLRESSTKLGIKGLAGNPISDIFTAPFYGVGVGASLFVGGSIELAANANGLFFHDNSGNIGVGVELEGLMIEFFPLDESKYQRIRDIVLE